MHHQVKRLYVGINSRSKMKTKEVDVYVPSIVLTSFARAEMFTSKARDMIDGEWVKARLIIELPEKKITISESEFEEYIKQCISFSNLKTLLFKV